MGQSNNIYQSVETGSSVSEVAPVGLDNTRPLGYPTISNDSTVDEALSGRIVARFTPRMAESIRDTSFDYLLPLFGILRRKRLFPIRRRIFGRIYC